LPRFFFLRLGALPLAVCLAACSLAPVQERPALELPAAQEAAPLEAQWWRRFDDPLLNELVAEALAHNRDLLVAQARVEQAAAMARRAVGDLFLRPVLDAQGGEQRLSSLTEGGPPPEANRVTNNSVDIRAAWELDFWGKYRNAARAADAALRQTAADRDALALLVAGNVVKAYSSLLTARQQAQIAGETVVQREEAERLQGNMVAVGGEDEVSLLRMRGELAQARYNLWTARQVEARAATALGLLLGRSPARIMDGQLVQTGAQAMLRANPLPEKLAFDLLEQRPDVRAAEYALMAANFKVGVVRANYLPAISISASAGTAARHLDSLGEASSSTWSVLGIIQLPLDFWNTHFQAQMAKADSRAAAFAYEKTVQTAFADVRDALAGVRNLEEAGQALTLMESSLARAAEVAHNRYRYGYANYMDVLDAGRALLSARLERAAHRNARIAAEVDLYLALGGGWREDASPGMAQPPLVP
jgi:multidrug efflux system outer membrane protein